MRNLFSFVFASGIALFMVGAPIGYKVWHDKQTRNFRVVEEGVLYRSAQLPLTHLQQVLTTHNIRTVVCLRDGKDPADRDEEAWVKARGLNFVRIAPRPWFPDAAGDIPAESCAQAFREVMDDPAHYPVLVHCFAGIHRTGILCALFRMDHQGWTNAEAEAEMRLMGYRVLDDHEDVLSYLAKYRPQRTSKTVPATPVKRQINARP
jgi:tyrosine-protein phosphatase SIW14